MKLSFSRLGNYGRFGNSFFQVASCMGLADKYNASISFPGWEYEPYFVNRLPHGEMQEKQVKEKHFHYYDWDLTESCDILGYLQSERYFEHIADKVKEQFKIKPELIEEVKAKLPEGLFDKTTILIQTRRTDYVGCHAYYQLPVTYYISALYQYFPNWQECNLVFISDDLSYAKIHLGCLHNAFFIDVPDIQQIVVAGFCDHYIIANSTFGWVAAWLGQKPHSKVVYPGHLFAGKMKEENDASDWGCERWIKFQKDDYKLDLKDTTFLIPVHFDHQDRKKNLDLSVAILQKNFETNIIVGEQGGSRFIYASHYGKYMPFPKMREFHRTKMLNDMATAAETPFIANWDCDVIIPPLQIYLSVERLRKGVDMIFPYDGRFARLPRVPWYNEIAQLLDIGAIGDEEPKGKRGRPVPESSVGGAIFFNKESFIEGGMENENFISFGPEDCERNDRFKKLGFKVERIGTDENNNCGKRLGGCLYHIDHFVGLNSSSRNPHFKNNHRELEKIRKMSVQELREYVDQFSWRNKYTERYYRKISEGAIRSAKEVYKALDELGVSHETVIDVGCGVGEWSNGKTYFGIDYSIPKRNLIISLENYIECDLEKNVVRMVDKFDLCLCLEVAEHISEARADALIEMLCNLSDKVLFSAAIPMQGGTGHVNEQWQSYWADKFANYGFFQPKIGYMLRRRILYNSDIELWYRQNIVLYERMDYRPEESSYWVNDYVHPKYYEQIVSHYKRQLEAKTA